MKKTLLLTFLSFFFYASVNAQAVNDTTSENEIDITESIESNLKYQTGVIKLADGNATLTVPKGFKYLNKEQSIYVLTDLWGNPEDTTVLGLLVPENMGVMDAKSWVFSINYDEMGYVKDDDAEDINYDDLLAEQQKEGKENNIEREKLGYEPIDFIGWASKPFYDKEKKTLHWAKELKFGNDSVNTLNYNLRILGRKGIFMLNAIASMNEIEEVKASINNVISSVQFDEGSKYADFNPDVDEVAAWTIGGLVAGKILAKVGFFAIILKFWKIIALAVVAGGASFMKLFRRKKEEESPDAELVRNEDNTDDQQA